MATLIAFVRADAVIDVPVVPGAWEITQHDNRWSTVYPLGREDGRSFNVRLIARDGSQPQRACFVCTGPAGVLQRLADRIAADGLAWTRTWPTLAVLRADGTAAAIAVRGKWPDERPDAGSTLVALWARMAGALGEDAET